jgi:hypothetical protein
MTPKEWINAGIVATVVITVVFLFSGPSEEEEQKERIFAENQATYTELQRNIQTNEALKADIANNEKAQRIIEALYVEQTSIYQRELDEIKSATSGKVTEYNQLTGKLDAINAELAKKQNKLNQINNFDEVEQQKLSRLAELTSNIGMFSSVENEQNITKYNVTSSNRIVLVRYIMWDRQEIMYVRTGDVNDDGAVIQHNNLVSVSFADLDDSYREKLLQSRISGKYLGMMWVTLGEEPDQFYAKIDFDTGIRWLALSDQSVPWKPFSKLSETERNTYEELIAEKLEPSEKAE